MGAFATTLKKPYYRIFRPSPGGSSLGYRLMGKYIVDERYANDRTLLCRAYDLIINDLKMLFEYVEPTDKNLNTYSHRTFELLLRASTEFETNCKRILMANGYKKKKMNITDYFKINKATKLSEYEIIMDFWRPERKIIRPFEDWKKGQELTWYQEYNEVKHDRNEKFPKASLENVLEAVSGLTATLFSQFEVFSFDPYQITNEYSFYSDGLILGEKAIFGIKIPAWGVVKCMALTGRPSKAKQIRLTNFILNN